MLSKKIEYPPLLSAGFHKKSLEECKGLLVDPFHGTSDRRPLIYNKFCKFIDMLRKISVHFEVWIDGSFTTKKQEPDDIDIVIFAEQKEINRLSIQDRNLLSNLLNNAKTRQEYLTDVYFGPRDNQNIRSYWRGWYGFTRNEKPKGIIVLEV
ncbi:MAG: DUF6932 family protein [Treponema sp.]